jgi:hypothetical protein
MPVVVIRSALSPLSLTTTGAATSIRSGTQLNVVIAPQRSTPHRRVVCVIVPTADH